MAIVDGDRVAGRGLLDGREFPKGLDLVDRYVNAAARAVGWLLAVDLDRLGVQDAPGLQGYELGLRLTMMMIALGLVAERVPEQVDRQFVEAELHLVAHGAAERPGGHGDEAVAQGLQGQEDRLQAERTGQQAGAHLCDS